MVVPGGTERAGPPYVESGSRERAAEWASGAVREAGPRSSCGPAGQAEIEEARCHKQN